MEPPGVRIAYTGRFGMADEISLDASPSNSTLPNTYFWDLDAPANDEIEGVATATGTPTSRVFVRLTASK